MRITDKLLAGALSLFVLASCSNESFEGFDGNKDVATGVAQLNIDVKKPQSRAVSETQDFPVIVYNKAGDKVESYDAVSLVPAKVILPVGNYTVESHTPGVIRKKMSEPYYKGVEAMEIIKDITSQVTVICKMQNSPVTVSYSDEFRSVFTSWEITISDGSETALSFDNNSATNTVYYWFGDEGVKELTVNFRGVTADGSIIASRSVLTKSQANEGYDDDRANFGGGDALKLNFHPTESTDGKITNINITANVTFTETNEDVTVDVVDKPGFDEGAGGENPGGGDEPSEPTPGNPDAISLKLPNDMTVNAETDPALGNALIQASRGIQSIRVSIASTSEEMISSLSDLNDSYGVDFINGAEVVENQDLVSLFKDLNQELTVPNSGDTEYTFPIGNFFGLLVFLSGDHTFNLVVTDADGNTKSGKLTLTVAE